MAQQKSTGDSSSVLVNCTHRKGTLSKPISPVLELAYRHGEGDRDSKGPGRGRIPENCVKVGPG